jgi:hypothetical protein
MFPMLAEQSGAFALRGVIWSLLLFRVERAAPTAFPEPGAGSPVGPAARTRKREPTKSALLFAERGRV